MTVRDLRALVSLRMLTLHAIAIAAIAAMVVLGLWQMGAYDERQSISARERASRPPVPIDTVLGPDEAFSADADSRLVVVRGKYVEPQLLVDGDDDPVPWVVTPLRTSSGSAVLVVRGRGEGATPPPGGTVEVTGVLLPSQARADDPNPGDAVEPSLSTARLVGRVPVDLYSGYVVAREADPGLSPVEPPTVEPSFTAGLRNFMYALQWWAFACFAAYLWWRIARDELRGRRPG